MCMMVMWMCSELVDCVQHEHADVMGVFLRNIVKKG